MDQFSCNQKILHFFPENSNKSSYIIIFEVKICLIKKKKKLCVIFLTSVHTASVLVDFLRAD